MIDWIHRRILGVKLHRYKHIGTRLFGVSAAGRVTRARRAAVLLGLLARDFDTDLSAASSGPVVDATAKWGNASDHFACVAAIRCPMMASGSTPDRVLKLLDRERAPTAKDDGMLSGTDLHTRPSR